MKKILTLIGLCVLLCCPALGNTNCTYGNDPVENFKNCSPKNVIQEGSKPDFDVTDNGGDFIDMIKDIVEKIQVIAFYLSVAIIVWLGLIMVLPGNAEAKESTKSKLVSVLIGFLFMIGATILVNAIIYVLYEIF